MSSLNRRGFLGTAIGLLTIRRFPFIAKEALFLKSLLSVDDRVSSLMSDKIRMAIDMRIDGQREWIEGKLLQIERTTDNIVIVHEPVTIYQDMTTFGAKIMAKDGKVICSKNWNFPQFLQAEDTLKPSYQITLS